MNHDERVMALAFSIAATQAGRDIEEVIDVLERIPDNTVEMLMELHQGPDAAEREFANMLEELT